MSKTSAGILLYRYKEDAIEFMLVHPGGPFWKNKDDGSWSIPKGEFTDNENALDAAKREFAEELGQTLPHGKMIELSPVKQNSGKTVYAWAVEADLDVQNVNSNFFKMEFPPNSGKWIEVPEVDRAEWFSVDDVKQKIIRGQWPLVEELLKKLNQ